MALATLLVGGLLTTGGAWLQRVWRREDDSDRRKAAVEAEGRSRVAAALDSILIEQGRARLLMRELMSQPKPDMTSLHDVAEQIDRLTNVLPDKSARVELEEHAWVMCWANPIADRDDEARSPVDVAWYSSTRIGIVAGALLRGESPPPESALLTKRRRLLVEIELETNPETNAHRDA